MFAQKQNKLNKMKIFRLAICLNDIYFCDAICHFSFWFLFTHNFSIFKLVL